MTAQHTKDVDILTSIEVLDILADAIDNRRGGFHRECDGEIRWTKCDANNIDEFQVTVELVLLGGPFVRAVIFPPRALVPSACTLITARPPATMPFLPLAL
jgi:hypothetical protein